MPEAVGFIPPRLFQGYDFVQAATRHGGSGQVPGAHAAPGFLSYVRTAEFT